jgi:Ca2+-binding EF-hand superfamily protein
MGKAGRNTDTRDDRGQQGAKRQKRGTVSTKANGPDPETIDAVFSVFDAHENGRITRDDIRKVANQHEVNLTDAELRDMISYFDKSGTATLSRKDFGQLWVDANV